MDPARVSTHRRRTLRCAATLPLLPLLPAAARGQSRFPTRAVKIIVPQPPGGAADRLARLFGERLELLWGQPVVVENRPGGGVIVGTQAVARAPADGHTIGLLGSSLSINAVQRSDLPYAIRDLQPLARIGFYTVVLVAAAGFPASDVKSLIAYAKRQPPGSISFGSNGIGTSAQLAGEMLNHMAGIELQHVPYNGAAKMYNDILGGVLPIGFSIASSAETFVKSGQMKVLGVTTAQRSAVYPDWPTIAETLPGFEAVNWAGFCGPAGMPAELVQRLGRDLLGVLGTPEMAVALSSMGIETAAQGPEAFGTFIGDEVKRFAAVTRPLNLK